MKQKIHLGWRSVWFTLVSVQFLSTEVLSSRISATEKYPRINDKNWWLWNQEEKEKPETLEDAQRKEEKETHQLVMKRLVPPFNTDPVPFCLPSAEELLTHHMVNKRWLSGGMGFVGKKKQQKEQLKWFVDTQLSGPESLPSAQVVQDPWMSRKRQQMHRKDQQTDAKPQRKLSVGTKTRTRKLKFFPKKFASQQKYVENQSTLNINDKLHRNANFTTSNKNNNVHSSAVAQLHERKARPHEYQRMQPLSAYQQLWNKSINPAWGQHRAFEDFRFNQQTKSILSSSIKLYTTPNYRWVRTSEPPLESRIIQNDDISPTALDREKEDSGGILESKGLAKSTNKKCNDLKQQRRCYEEYELVPKVYALNKLRSGKKDDKNENDCYGSLSFSGANPIIVPGFKRKHTEAPENEQVSIRPYVIHAEEQHAPFDDEFVQVYRGNRNQSRNVFSVNEHNKITAAGTIPIQLPSPYAIPGGVNISILMPNPPAAYSHDTPLSTMTSSTERDKNIKKKKERKKKVKNDEVLENIQSEPRSLLSTGVNVGRFPHAEKSNPLMGEDDVRFSGMQLINYRPQLNNTNNVNPLFDLKTDNFSLLKHIRNISLNHLDWDSPLFGVMADHIKKPTDYSEDGDDDDEIRMLYDEHTSSTTTVQSDEKGHVGSTASFSWYGLSDYPRRKSSFQHISRIGKYITSSEAKQMMTFNLEDSGKVSEERNNANIKSYSNNIDIKTKGNWQELKRSVLDRKRGVPDSKATNEQNIQFQKPIDRESKIYYGKPTDQWDALDETLKSEITANGNDGAWQAINRKREADYETHQANNDQEYYRLSPGGNSFRNPTNLIMSVFRGKPNKHLQRDYYDDIPEERIREQMRPNIAVPPNFPR